MSTQILLFILAALMIGISIFFGMRIFSIYRRKRAGEYWPVITGTVTNRAVNSSRNTQTNGYTYRAEITYNYPTPGGSIEKKLSLGSKSLRDQAQKLLDEVGETIQVRYNPEKPQEQITDFEKIRPADIFSVIATLALAIVLIIIAL